MNQRKVKNPQQSEMVELADTLAPMSSPRNSSMPRNASSPENKSLFVAYFCWAFGGIFGAHKAYLGDKDGAREYMFSFGLCLVGWAWDGTRLSEMVEAYNDQLSMRIGGKRVVRSLDIETAARFPDNTVSNTKYGITLKEIAILFVPKNFSEQFSRHINRYFLFIACLQLWSYITPTNPWTTFGPLILIFMISAAREGSDDAARYRADLQANSKPVQIVRDRHLVSSISSDIHVGDIVKVEDGEELPCDLVVLKTSESDGLCYIQTTNLDGESDFKPRIAPQVTASMHDKDLFGINAMVECAPPNKLVYKFDSTLTLDSQSISLSSENLLLQATHLRNVSWAYGLVVYTGNQTKFGQNKRPAPIKWAVVDRMINRLTIIIFIFQLCLVAILGGIGASYQRRNGVKMWYLGFESVPAVEDIVVPLRFLLLNSTMIPISIKVTLDLCKLMYSKFIGWDVEMEDKETEEGTIPRNTGLAEDLGQVEYVLSDKTGTLTENRMVFRQASVNGSVYGSVTAADVFATPSLSSAISERDNHIRDFFLALAACNTVIPVKSGNGERLKTKQGIPVYKAANPDEEALVQASALAGIVLVDRDREGFTLDVWGKEKRFDLVQEFEFSSERKRMSVLVRDSDGKLKLFSKGADDRMMKRLSDGQDEIGTTTQEHIDALGAQGLRTLVVCQRRVDEEEFQSWREGPWKKAELALDGRDILRAAAFDEMEQNLRLVGASAIEDKLQEQVPETIAALREAGIKFWMLTGDKLSTAIEIATTCRMRDSTNSPMVVIEASDRGHLQELVRGATSRLQGFADWDPIAARKEELTIVITGASLDLFTEFELQRFMKQCMRASAVVCCRLSPTQKAELVRAVKVAGEQLRRGELTSKILGCAEMTTLAIGDGGNDVPMIQEAHVGVGIAGREGMQASRAADYSINMFKQLRRLLFVHGRMSYERSSYIAQYSFFKSWVFCLIQIMYAGVSSFSGVSLFDSLAIMAVNALLFVPICFFTLNKDVPIKAAYRFPALYSVGRSRQRFNLSTVSLWVGRAVMQALFVFLGTVMFAQDFIDTHGGSTAGYKELGVVTFMNYNAVQTVTLMIDSNTVTLLQAGIIWGFFGLAWLAYAVANAVPRLSGLADYFVFFRTVAVSPFYLTMLWCVVACCLPVAASKFISNWYYASDTDIARQNIKRSLAPDSLKMSASLLQRADDTASTTSEADI